MESHRAGYEGLSAESASVSVVPLGVCVQFNHGGLRENSGSSHFHLRVLVTLSDCLRSHVIVLAVRLRHASLTLGHGHQVALDCAEWEGMTDLAHIMFTRRATPLPPAPALRHNRPDKSKNVAPSTPERALPEN